MRVLMVAGEYPPMKGGISRYTANLVGALAKKARIDVATNAVHAGAHSENAAIHPVVIKGDRGNSDRLLALVSELKPDVVNVQYERGLYEIDTPAHMLSNILFGSTLDKFYRESKVPVVSTIHTVYPYDEYRDYVQQRAARKGGKLGVLPRRLRVVVRSKMMEYRYRLLLHVANLSYEIISPTQTIRDIVKRGAVIYHGAEPAQTMDLTQNRDNLRREFGLPSDKMLLLAFGYAGFYKGFDLLEGLVLPEGWVLVVKQDRHERGAEHPIQIGSAINLNIGYLDDEILSKLFLACDAIAFPYKVVSVSGVMFDALAHGLPFVASDLAFFREFAEMGLGIVSKRDSESFSRSLSHLAQNYSQYKRNILQFAPHLQWDKIADQHIQLYARVIKQYAASTAS
ncbi:MAG: glycosyl transferase [Nitrososphaera sp.]|jgi:glycosyltransferase involved in cell wall biosynthesis